MVANFRTVRSSIIVFLVFLAMVLPRLVLCQEFGFATEGDTADVASEESVSEEDDDANGLYRMQWIVPPIFVKRSTGGGSPGVVDPFAEPESLRPALPVRITALEVLESAGILFPPGTSAKYFEKTSLLTVVNTLDQLELVEAYIGCGCCLHVEKQIYVFVEWIEVESTIYHDWMFENRITQDGTALRKQVQKWVKSGQGTILETSSVVCRSGQRARTESHSAVIYPNYSDPPKVPKKVTLEGGSQASLVVGTTTETTDSRNVGTILEVDVVLAADEFTIDMSLAPEMVTGNGFSDWPPGGDGILDTVSIPRFRKMKTSTQVTIHDGQYAILGTTRRVDDSGAVDPEMIVLSFVRGDIGRLGEEYSVPVPIPVKVGDIER